MMLHTAANIQHFLEEKIREFGLENKVVAVTTDNGANIKSAVCTSGLNIPHVGCFAHTLDLAVSKAITLIPAVVMLREKVTSIVTMTRRSTTAKTDFLKSLKECNMEQKVLIQDVPTHWKFGTVSTIASKDFLKTGHHDVCNSS